MISPDDQPGRRTGVTNRVTRQSGNVVVVEFVVLVVLVEVVVVGRTVVTVLLGAVTLGPVTVVDGAEGAVDDVVVEELDEVVVDDVEVEEVDVGVTVCSGRGVSAGRSGSVQRICVD